jgi:hypothetical protein
MIAGGLPLGLIVRSTEPFENAARQAPAHVKLLKP